jgi:hypothetical protein
LTRVKILVLSGGVAFTTSSSHQPEAVLVYHDRAPLMRRCHCTPLRIFAL